jgi:hypothetical protein
MTCVKKVVDREEISMPVPAGITEVEVLSQTIAVLTRKKVAFERLNIITLMQVIMDDPRVSLTCPELQNWYKDASSQDVFIMYNRVEQIYRGEH